VPKTANRLSAERIRELAMRGAETLLKQQPRLVIRRPDSSSPEAGTGHVGLAGRVPGIELSRACPGIYLGGNGRPCFNSRTIRSSPVNSQ
jgi:hypothetical protein